MELLTVFLVIIFVMWFFGQIAAGGGNAGVQQGRNELKRRVEEGLKVICDFEDVAEEQESEKYFVARVKISGSIVVPVDNQPVNWRINITDETDGDDSPYALFCDIPECANEDSIYEVKQESHIPYVFSEVDDFSLTGIPLFALCGPRKGARKWRVHVSLLNKWDDDNVFTYGSCLFNFTQKRVGYLEFKEHSLRQEKNMAILALAMAAADHEVSKRETSIIRSYFSTRLDSLEDATERKRNITDCLQTTLSSINQGERADELIKTACRSLIGDDDTEACQAAFELCAKVAAADDALDKNEEAALRFIAAKLKIDSGYVAEVRDREIRTHMYGNQSDDLLRQLGGPPSLSAEEQREWLQNDYEKWRPRQSNADPEIATEATLRIDTIMTLLTSMDK